MLKEIRSELGYREKGGGTSKFGQWYAARVQDTQYRDGPWCDMLIAWAADRAGVGKYVGQFAWTPSHAKWFMTMHAWTSKPEPGALVFFDWSGGKGYTGIDHVGVVESVSGSKIHTLEGNIDRGVLKAKTRDQSKVVGYGVPRLVKAYLDAGGIRATERPFVMTQPRPERPVTLDFGVIPQVLLATMVLLTVLLSMRWVRSNGRHRRGILALLRLRRATAKPAPAAVPRPRTAPSSGVKRTSKSKPEVRRTSSRMPGLERVRATPSGLGTDREIDDTDRFLPYLERSPEEQPVRLRPYEPRPRKRTPA